MNGDILDDRDEVNDEPNINMALPGMRMEALSWKRMLLLYESALEVINAKITVLNKEFVLRFGYTPIEHISSRIKSPQSIMRKLKVNHRDPLIGNVVRYINDIAGIRIICSFTTDIYTIAELIASQNDVKVLKVKDYIAHPKENGYMSYHMIVSVPVYLSQQVVFTKVEIQIRTIAMDFWASLEHKMYYKFDGNAPEHIRRELKECADITAFLDRKMLALNEEIQNYKVPEVTESFAGVSDSCDIYKDTAYKEETIEEMFGVYIEESISVREITPEVIENNEK